MVRQETIQLKDEAMSHVLVPLHIIPPPSAAELRQLHYP